MRISALFASVRSWRGIDLRCIWKHNLNCRTRRLRIGSFIAFIHKIHFVGYFWLEWAHNNAPMGRSPVHEHGKIFKKCVPIDSRTLVRIFALSSDSERVVRMAMNALIAAKLSPPQLQPNYFRALSATTFLHICIFSTNFKQRNLFFCSTFMSKRNINANY